MISLASASLQRDFRDCLANGFWQVQEGTSLKNRGSENYLIGGPLYLIFFNQKFKDAVISLASASLQRDFRDGLANGFWQVREGTKKEHHPI